MRIRLLLILVCFVAFMVATGSAHASRCHTTGHAPFTAPSNACTPGSFVRLSRAEVCQSKDRPTLRAAVRRRVLADYGVPGWTGANGELDHRIPFFLGGLATASNLWPETGTIPNPKDRLEAYVRRRVCLRRPHPMTVRTARLIFAG